MVPFRTFVSMEPVAKARARTTSKGSFTPTKTKNAEYRIQWQVSQEWKQPILDEPTRLRVIVYVQKPKSKKKSERWATTRPDGDNYLKLVLDALNGVVWKDDACVVDMRVMKVWITDRQPGFQIDVTPAGEWYEDLSDYSSLQPWALYPVPIQQ